MMRAGRPALGSPDHKALLAPLVLQGLDSKLLQRSNALNSQTWGHVQWVPAGVSRQAWCTTEPSLPCQVAHQHQSQRCSSAVCTSCQGFTQPKVHTCLRRRAPGLCAGGTRYFCSFWGVFPVLWGPDIGSAMQNSGHQKIDLIVGWNRQGQAELRCAVVKGWLFLERKHPPAPPAVLWNFKAPFQTHVLPQSPPQPSSAPPGPCYHLPSSLWEPWGDSSAWGLLLHGTFLIAELINLKTSLLGLLPGNLFLWAYPSLGIRLPALVGEHSNSW